MTVESAADRAGFMADFGVEATATRGGTSVTVRGIPERPTRLEDGPTDAGALAVQASFLCVADDLPADYGAGDGLSLDGRAYRVRDLRPDGTGLTLLNLERA